MSTQPSSAPNSERIHWQSSAQLEYAISHIFLPAVHRHDEPDTISAESNYQAAEKNMEDPENTKLKSPAKRKLKYPVEKNKDPVEKKLKYPVEKNKYPVEKNESLARAVCAVAHAYYETADDSLKPHWRPITKMLDNLQAFLQPEGLAQGQVASQLHEMETGDSLVFLNKSQDAAAIFTKQVHCTLYQSFSGVGDLCAIEIPDEVFHSRHFQSELAGFLLLPDGCGRLLTSILRGVGRSTEVALHTIECIQSHYKLQFRRRSLLWLLVKVVFRTAGGLGHIWYKVFVLHLMCNLAMDAMDANLPSHLLHAVSCKILRRSGKLGSSAPNWLHEMVLEISVSLRETLETRWRKIQATRPLPPLWKPSRLDLDGDTQLSLLGSKEYICSSLMNNGREPLPSPFYPKHLLRGTLNDFLSLTGNFFEKAYRLDRYIALYDVEQGVEQGIDDWLTCVTDAGQACTQVEVLMDKYLSSARDAYKSNPEHISIMFLTALELWVALDKLVVGMVPVLAEYFPGVPEDLLHKPLFRNTMKLHRLRRAYQYISVRYARFLLRESTFSGETTQDILVAVRYDVNSLDHFNSPDLNHIWRYGAILRPHTKIVAIFELHCPTSLAIWGFTTIRLLNRLFSPQYAAPLLALSPLNPCLIEQWTSPVTKRAYMVCFNPKDLKQQNTSRNISGDDRAKLFSYRDPMSHQMCQYINGTSHTSNDVLAAQAQCPVDLSSHEFTSFGHLRSGGSLQWVNILQELRRKALNFRRHDVYLLFAMAASQVGPFDLNTAEWEWSWELQESFFCNALLNELESLLLDVAVHSLDGVMMGVISLLLTRLLASSPCEDVSQRVFTLLQRARKKTIYWVQELSYDLMMSPMDIKRKDRLRDMAATFRSTFDVGPDLAHKLIRSAEDVGALLLCAILIQANRPIDLECVSEYSRLLLERDRRLSLDLESVLRDVIQADGSNRGIDLAVCTVWSGYRSGPRVWQALPRPSSHWFTCETAATQGRRSQTMHLNLLDGALLVDGKPIGGLPHEIRKYPMYRRIFGDELFLVVASDLPGMDYCTLAMVCEHRVHFVLRGDNLVIRAQHKDMADILEIVPSEKLQGDLLAKFVDGHVHWLNLTTSIIEIRPLGRLWEESIENWRIDCRPGQYRMYSGSEWLVDIRSPTYDMVANRLECLDLRRNLIITTLPVNALESLSIRRLSVVLPRYGLSFFVNEDGELESCDFKDMVYDSNQCVGTLFGLESRLVLRPNMEVEEELIHRCIIIPDGGLVSREERGHLARITIDAVSSKNNSRDSVRYHTYRVDTDLGCLASDGGWRSKPYLAYLHAQTSVDWMPDPLTSKTGIQEALCLLRSAACRSIMELSDTGGEKLELPSIDNEILPQLKFAMQEIEYRIQRDKFLRNGVSRPPGRPKLDALGALRVAYLFPYEVVEPAPKSIEVGPPKTSEPEDSAYIVSLAVYHWLIKAENETQDDTELADTPTWADPDRLPPLIVEADALFEKHQSLWHGSHRQKQQPSIAEVEDFLRQATEARQRFRLLFLLPAIVYSLNHDHEPTFLSFLVALAKRFPLKHPPRYNQCCPSYGVSPSDAAIRDHYVKAQRPESESQDGDKHTDAAFRKVFKKWAFKTGMQVVLLKYSDWSDLGLDSWDLDDLGLNLDLDDDDLNLYNIKELSTELKLLISRCYRNRKLKENLTRRLMKLPFLPANPNQLSRQISDMPFQPDRQQLTLEQLLYVRSPPKLPHPKRLRRHSAPRTASHVNGTCTLDQLLSSRWIKDTIPAFQEQYVTHLHDSSLYAREAYPMQGRVVGKLSIRVVKELRRHYMRCRNNYTKALTTLRKALCPFNDPRAQVLRWSGPCLPITPDTLLRCLASTSHIKLSDGWRKCLVSLALLLAQLQRSRRLLRFALDNLHEEFSRELENEGCDGWSAQEHPDWLLIQVQGNFLIRGIQADVAMNMISPPSNKNTAIQVNMGEGKSSVILPMSAATLADGNQLVRVIVPRALVVQMFQSLVHRLGGFTNRPIYHLPFSRSFFTGKGDTKRVEILRELLAECMRDHGILVVQPEHVISLQLTGVEQQLPNGGNSYNNPRDALLKLQKWIHAHVRDILDESDDILHPRFQLIYTVGSQRHIEGYPDRWIITQQVLRLVRKHTLSLSHNLPDAIEYERNASGSFPRIRILRASDAGPRLISLISNDVINGRLSIMSTLHKDISYDQQLRSAIHDFISSEGVDKNAHMVEEYGRKTGLWEGLLLLRGLLACNVLLFALAERRWSVDYGLSPTRTKLAVPYRAKDVPAPTAEFGHPDITILLTCLSYYYGGLTEEQLRTSFEILQEQDDPSVEYENWLQDYEPDSVPVHVRDLRNVNIKSSEVWDKCLIPLFSRSQGAVDFYLSRVVFPKEALEFPSKITASSWDLAEVRERPITGFSGTNDGQYLLPTSIAQHDLDHQRGSNARVLSHLLQPENNSYALISYPNGERQTILELLQTVVSQEPKIHVLLDVGAQILDFSNYQLAKVWLDLSSDSEGAVYFNEGDEPMVLTKDGVFRPLVSSPHAQRLDRCIVYLDDAHTRGTDLKFPRGSRAAVTLGPKVTKDRLVQGCMRMRKLGHGHSIMFLAPLEVDGSIRAIAAKNDPSIPVTTADILRWAIHETWTDIQHWAPYWALQGINYDSRHDAWSRFCRSSLTRKKLAVAWSQPEFKSLADLYAPFQPKDALNGSFVLGDYPKIHQHCKYLGVSQLPDTRMGEEQEREVNREIEREREAQKCQSKAKPANHSLHPAVVTFVRTGVVPALYIGSVFRPVFTALKETSAGTVNGRPWSPFVLATSDFCKTVKRISSREDMDRYLRPVQWVLSGKWHHNRVLVIISPFEADRLMPDIRDSKYVHLHLYTPHTSKRMRPVDELTLFTIPPIPDNWTPPRDLIDQLNVFAGQLYLRDYDSYLRLRRFLRIQDRDVPMNTRTAVRRNLITPGILREIENLFRSSPLPLVTKLLVIRQRGLSFAQTHMGRILQGERLTENDFKIVTHPSSQKDFRIVARTSPDDRHETAFIEDSASTISLSLSYVEEGTRDH